MIAVAGGRAAAHGTFTTGAAALLGPQPRPDRLSRAGSRAGWLRRTATGAKLSYLIARAPPRRSYVIAPT